MPDIEREKKEAKKARAQRLQYNETVRQDYYSAGRYVPSCFVGFFSISRRSRSCRLYRMAKR